MRRRDVLWWAFFGVAVSALLAVGAWIYLGGELPQPIFALISACGLALSATYRIFGVQGIRRRRPRAEVRR